MMMRSLFFTVKLRTVKLFLGDRRLSFVWVKIVEMIIIYQDLSRRRRKRQQYLAAWAEAKLAEG